MEVSQVDMENISGNATKPRISPIDGFAAQGQNAINKENNQAPKDTIVFDKTRVSLRNLCESGEALNNIVDIINSGIEPDFLRAELAFRFSLNDRVGMNIVLNYLAGNFKTALEQTEKLLSEENAKKFNEFICFSDYFAGNYEKNCAALQSMNEINMSPFFCYAYSDMLLSLGFLDEARKFNLKYEVLAKKYLPDFVSEKEKFDEERKRRNQKLRQKKEKSSNKKNAGNNTVNYEKQNFDESIMDLMSRRRKLVKALTLKNISINKKPLLFELEDIDYKIAKRAEIRNIK